MEDNGQTINESRLNRLDLVRERMVRDGEDFSTYYQRLVAPRIVWLNPHLNMDDADSTLESSLTRLAEKVREIGENLDRLIAWSEQTRRENEVRFRRLEEKQ
jgi:hypothetical protein